MGYDCRTHWLLCLNKWHLSLCVCAQQRSLQSSILHKEEVLCTLDYRLSFYEMSLIHPLPFPPHTHMDRTANSHINLLTVDRLFNGLEQTKWRLDHIWYLTQSLSEGLDFSAYRMDYDLHYFVAKISFLLVNDIALNLYTFHIITFPTSANYKLGNFSIS